MPPHVSQISRTSLTPYHPAFGGGNAALTKTKSKKVDRKRRKKKNHTRFKNTNQHEIHY
jgi:hypothetical protein